MSRREIDKARFDLDLSFARLELLEVEAGKRTLGQCPAVERMAEHIERYKKELSRSSSQLF